MELIEKPCAEKSTLYQSIILNKAIDDDNNNDNEDQEKTQM